MRAAIGVLQACVKAAFGDARQFANVATVDIGLAVTPFAIRLASVAAHRLDNLAPKAFWAIVVDALTAHTMRRTGAIAVVDTTAGGIGGCRGAAGLRAVGCQASVGDALKALTVLVTVEAGIVAAAGYGTIQPAKAKQQRQIATPQAPPSLL